MIVLYIANDPDIANGVLAYRKEVVACKTVEEYLKKLEEYRSTPYYDINTSYLDPYSSYKFISAWLKFQFPNQLHRLNFTTKLFKWINKSEKKRTMFVMVGPPDSGKTTITTSK